MVKQSEAIRRLASASILWPERRKVGRARLQSLLEPIRERAIGRDQLSILTVQSLLMALQALTCLENLPRTRQQSSDAIKPEEPISGFRVGLFVGGHAFYRVQHATIHREPVCIK